MLQKLFTLNKSKISHPATRSHPTTTTTTKYVTEFFKPIILAWNLVKLIEYLKNNSSILKLKKNI
ncbi:hypothetical protein BpHYR1_019208 [Brachionus plicatilis]|uniref:Uncharacterized protein n=1 Tax=Brachionus plicatilis TaxID=10195 RepID=A0A3M7REV8_BRAPC|nr:hypothetical protein BpHYR1_019208 [Brachionus plicatilis]